MKTVFITFAFVCLAISVSSQSKNFIDQPYIEVNGSADSLVTPNEIYVKIIISEKDTRDRIPLEELEIKMVNTLKANGINTEKDLTTSDILSNFQYYLLKSKDVIKTKQYILKVSDAITVSKIFIQLEQLGISNASIDRVDHSALEQIKNLLRTKAVLNAQTKAIALTKPLNQALGNAIHIVDNDAGNVLQGRLAGINIRGAASYNNISPELPKIDFEKIKVGADIRVTFVLK